MHYAQQGFASDHYSYPARTKWLVQANLSSSRAWLRACAHGWSDWHVGLETTCAAFLLR